jgi:uncharacterized Zn-binding protein involved in type VI secretion
MPEAFATDPTQERTLMFRRIIREGDTTTHGGKVINGSDRHRLEGRRIARLGDEVDCPAKYPGGTPHGINGTTEQYALGIAVFLTDGRLLADPALGDWLAGKPWQGKGMEDALAEFIEGKE